MSLVESRTGNIMTKEKGGFKASKIVYDIKKELQRMEAEEKLLSMTICYDHNDYSQYNGRAFLKKIYHDLLGREVDPMWEETYLKLLKEGKMSKNEMVSLLKESDEYRQASTSSSEFHLKESYTYDDFTQYEGETFIRNVFLGLLKRQADQAALDYYMNLMATGNISKDAIISDLRNSDEGQIANVELFR